MPVTPNVVTVAIPIFKWSISTRPRNIDSPRTSSNLSGNDVPIPTRFWSDLYTKSEAPSIRLVVPWNWTLNIVPPAPACTWVFCIHFGPVDPAIKKLFNVPLLFSTSYKNPSNRKLPSRWRCCDGSSVNIPT